MNRRKTNPYIVASLYGICAIIFVLGIYVVQMLVSKATFKPNDTDETTNYVDNEIINSNDQLPVISNETLIIRPYTNSDITIAKNFYDYKEEAEKQQDAIIYYEDTYMQNSGVDYKSENKFDVISILDGTVENIKEDNILGKIVEIRHTNDIISVYQSLSDISVKENDKVLAGQKIGTSGEANIDTSLGNHLHFELYIKGQIVNPEEYYDKNIEDL